MNPYYSKMAGQAIISKGEWEELVSYLNNDVALTLGARMFYILNQNGTHAFDNFLPGLMTNIPNLVVEKYKKQARKFVMILSLNTASEDVWYLAAQLLGVCNKKELF